MTTQPGLIKIYGGGKTPRKVYNRQEIDYLISRLIEAIDKKLAVLSPNPAGRKWIVEHNIFPPIEWGEDGSQWEIGPIIVEKDPQVSKDFAGSAWVIEDNIWPPPKDKIDGINWDIYDIIVDRDIEKITSDDPIGSVWEGVRFNLFPLVEWREGGEQWVVEANIEFPDQTAL